VTMCEGSLLVSWPVLTTCSKTNSAHVIRLFDCWVRCTSASEIRIVCHFNDHRHST